MSLHDRHLNSYHLYLKSHTEAPDYDDEVDAFSEEEAIELFQLSLDLDKETIRANMQII